MQASEADSTMLPWGAMFRAAAQAGVGPEAFWRLSVREWRWLAGGEAQGMGAGDLTNLLRKYPDKNSVIPDAKRTGIQDGED